MAFELRLTFFGLTALLPAKDASALGDAREWRVVMPDLSKGENLEFGGRRFPIAPHQAALVANAKAVREQPKEARLRFRNPTTTATDQESDLLYLLDREVLEIASGTPDSLRVRTGTLAASLPNVNDPDQLHDLKWLPQINDCLPDLRGRGGVPFDRTLFDPVTLRPTSDRLAAVVRLDRGLLETSDVIRMPDDDDPVTYEFRKISGELVFKQAIAESFRLRVTVEDETATLVLRQEGESRLVVGPYEGCPKEDGVCVVEVKIYNRELEEILGFGSDFLQDPGGGDFDFLIFYALSSIVGELNAADLVAPRLSDECGGAQRKPCEPPTYPGVG